MLFSDQFRDFFLPLLASSVFPSPVSFCDLDSHDLLLLLLLSCRRIWHRPFVVLYGETEARTSCGYSKIWLQNLQKQCFQKGTIFLLTTAIWHGIWRLKNCIVNERYFLFPFVMILLSYLVEDLTRLYIKPYVYLGCTNFGKWSGR